MAETDFPVLTDEVSDYADDMIGWNDLEMCYPIITARPFIRIAASVEKDFDKCGLTEKKGHFCVILSSPNQIINRVITHYYKIK